MKSALICGVTGQDGAYLARLLLDKGYHVWGTSRDSHLASVERLRAVGAADDVRLVSMGPTDFRSILSVLDAAGPDEIYNLAGQSSVGLSFEQPVATLESVATGTLNLLEAVRHSGGKARIYNASSSECFGDLGGQPAVECQPFRPCSPYAVAKSAAHWTTATYRDSYGLFACSGILFNHESPLRPARFVTRKIVAGACAIKAGKAERLRLGRLDISRDWGWAPEFVNAMWLMLQRSKPDDFIIATGVTYSLEQFVAQAFACLGLDWRAHVDLDLSLGRPSELTWSGANPLKAEHELGWRATLTMPDVVARMVEAEAR